VECSVDQADDAVVGQQVRAMILIDRWAEDTDWCRRTGAKIARGLKLSSSII
jgi:hypothetical protein